jgi:hypothetical protein
MIIVDIDNTLANNSHRYELATNPDGSINWDVLYDYDNVITDTPIQHIIDSVKFWNKSGYKIKLFTSRPERIREATEYWLNKYEVPYDELHMRSVEDHYIKDTELKRKMYNKFADGKVLFAIDDSQEIIDLWESLGILSYKINTIEYHTDLLLKNKDWEYPTSLEELGYIYFGPLLFSYFAWLKSELNGCDKVLFNSREGLFLLEIYNIFKQKFDLPEGVYFKTSRKLSLVASLFNKNDVYDSFKLHRYKGKLSNLLKDRFNIISSELDVEVDSHIELPDLSFCMNQILQKAEDTRKQYGEYVKSIISDSKNVVMVDSGYQGTTQQNIEKTYKLKFKGRYIIYKGNNLLEDVKGLYDFEKSKLKENLIFLESVFIDKVGSYIDIVNGEFKNEETNETHKYFEDKVEIVEGIKRFVLDMLKFDIDMNNVSYQKPAYIFDLMCNKNFVKNDTLFDNFYHDNLYVREGVKQIQRQ